MTRRNRNEVDIRSLPLAEWSTNLLPQDKFEKKPQQVQSPTKSMETLCRELDKMRTQEDAGSLCDFKLVCQNKTFHCHKAILAARSDYFKRLFGHQDFKENDKAEMSLAMEEEKHVDAFLNFIYGSPPNLQDFSDVVALIRMADKYFLEDLKSVCEEWLIDHTDSDFMTKSKEFLRLIEDLSGLDRLRKKLGKTIFRNRKFLTQEMLNGINTVGPEFLGDILKQA